MDKNPDWFKGFHSLEHAGKVFLVRYRGRNKGYPVSRWHWATFVDVAGYCQYDQAGRPLTLEGALFHVGADVSTRVTYISTEVFPHWDNEKCRWIHLNSNWIYDWTYLGKLENVAKKESPLEWFHNLACSCAAVYNQMVRHQHTVAAETIPIEQSDGSMLEKEYNAIGEASKCDGFWDARVNCQQFCLHLAEQWSLPWPSSSSSSSSSLQKPSSTPFIATMADMTTMPQAAATTVANYIIERLSREGIEHCFGVPGDYAFPLCEAVEQSTKVKWVGCANELNAAYAADGYARVRGAAMLLTTYAVGELSALNGVMGAKAEHSIVYHVVGMPSHQNMKLHKIIHHSLGDGVYGNFVNISAQAACVHAIIDPNNCVIEMERVIAEARHNSQPAYIVIPSDYARSHVTLAATMNPVVLKSNETSLEGAVEAIASRLASAKSTVVLPAFTLSRLQLHRETRRMIEALGCPFATTTMEKGLIDESHPQFAGMYSGALSTGTAREVVESADLVLDVGGVSLNDMSTSGFSAKLDPSHVVSIGLNEVRVGDKIFNSVRLADMIEALCSLTPKMPRYSRGPKTHTAGLHAMPTSLTMAGQPHAGVNPRGGGESHDKIMMDALYPRYASFMRSGDSVVLETGSSTLGFSPVHLADGVQVHSQMLWGSIGWATGAALGIALADEKRRTILITGEGSHQLTANEIGTMGRYGVNPIIFVLNNDGYQVERALEVCPDWSYNDLAKWRYTMIPEALGCQGWVVARVETLGELDSAMKAARESESGAYIEIVAGRMDMPQGLAFAQTRLKELYGDAP